MTVLSEQLAILGHRLDSLIAETQRIETDLLTSGYRNTARDLSCMVLELQLGKRSLAAIVHELDPPRRPYPPLHSVNGATA